MGGMREWILFAASLQRLVWSIVESQDLNLGFSCDCQQPNCWETICYLPELTLAGWRSHPTVSLTESYSANLPLSCMLIGQRGQHETLNAHDEFQSCFLYHTQNTVMPLCVRSSTWKCHVTFSDISRHIWSRLNSTISVHSMKGLTRTWVGAVAAVRRGSPPSIARKLRYSVLSICNVFHFINLVILPALLNVCALNF